MIRPSSRFLMLGTVCMVLLAGCTSGFSGSSTPPPKPEPTLTPKPIPDLPQNVTQDNVGEFAKQFEKAYKFNKALTPNTTDLTISPDVARVNRSGTGFLIKLDVGISEERLEYVPEQGEWQTGVGDGGYTVQYFINETTVIRSDEFGFGQKLPDPRESDFGTVVIKQSS